MDKVNFNIKTYPAAPETLFCSKVPIPLARLGKSIVLFGVFSVLQTDKSVREFKSVTK